MIWDKGRGIRTKRTCFSIKYISVTVLCVVCGVFFSENSLNNSFLFMFFSGLVNRALATVLCMFFAFLLFKLTAGNCGNTNPILATPGATLLRRRSG